MARSVQTLEEILAICLDDMQAGTTSAECLARYPDYADQLKPLLLAAERLQNQAWPILSPGGRVRGRARMHAALASRRPAGFARWPVLRPIFATVVLLVLAGGVWLAWPSRLSKNSGRSTSTPVGVQSTATPTLTQEPTSTPTPTLTPTPTPTPTPTGVATATGTVSSETDIPNEATQSDGTRLPSATATLRPRNTATPEARVNTPEPTQIASPGRPQETPHNDSAPEATSEVTEAPSATATRESTATRKPTHTREPTESTRPTNTPPSSPTAEPTEPPRATATGASTHTPESTETPRSSESSEPTKTPDHH